MVLKHIAQHTCTVVVSGQKRWLPFVMASLSSCVSRCARRSSVSASSYSVARYVCCSAHRGQSSPTPGRRCAYADTLCGNSSRDASFVRGVRARPTIRLCGGSEPSQPRAWSAETSFWLVRSPDAPKMTRTAGSALFVTSLICCCLVECPPGESPSCSILCFPQRAPRIGCGGRPDREAWNGRRCRSARFRPHGAGRG